MKRPDWALTNDEIRQLNVRKIWWTTMDHDEYVDFVKVISDSMQDLEWLREVMDEVKKDQHATDGICEILIERLDHIRNLAVCGLRMEQNMDKEILGKYRVPDDVIWNPKEGDE